MTESIHAIWLGKRMPPLSHACLDDWKKMGFSYQLWTEDNPQIRSWIDNCEFAKECYDRKLFDFVSGYLRLEELQKEGRPYLDTGVTIRRDPFPLFSGRSFVAGSYIPVAMRWGWSQAYLRGKSS